LWSRQGALRRQEDRAFAETLDEIDAVITSTTSRKHRDP